MTAASTDLQHGTFVKIGSVGVMITGPSGAGKSSLALQLIEAPGRGLGKDILETQLVADDQVQLWCPPDTAQVFGKAPDVLAGLLEIRGLGIVALASLGQCQLQLVVRLMKVENIERLPDFPNNYVEILNQPIPVVDIFAADAAAPARIRAAVSALTGDYLIEK